jgi:hypothetical protein
MSDDTISSTWGGGGVLPEKRHKEWLLRKLFEVRKKPDKVLKDYLYFQIDVAL